MNKLIDNEIIKTKEIIKNLHSYCFVSQPTYKKMGYKFRESDFDCLNNLVDESNRQKAEIERLNNELVSADEVIGFREAEIERLQKEVSKLKHEMSYMKSPNTIGDRNEMGCW